MGVSCAPTGSGRIAALVHVSAGCVRSLPVSVAVAVGVAVTVTVRAAPTVTVALAASDALECLEEARHTLHILVLYQALAACIVNCQASRVVVGLGLGLGLGLAFPSLDPGCVWPWSWGKVAPGGHQADRGATF